jgi:potassium voltage-gated channel Eag-related subfamily H protein 7
MGVFHFSVSCLFYCKRMLIETCLMTPFNVAFVDDSSWLLISIETFTDVVFVIDILMNFRFSYMNDQFELVSNKDKIAFHYLKTWFFIDFLSCFPVNIFFLYYSPVASGKSYTSYFQLLKLLRLFRLVKFIKERNKIIQLIGDILKIRNGLERLFFFIFLFFIAIHVNCCMWIYLANFKDLHQRTNWIEQKEVSNYERS